MWSKFLVGCIQTRQGSPFTPRLSQFNLLDQRGVNQKTVKPSPVHVYAAMVEGDKDANKTVWLGSGSSTRQALMREIVEEHGILFGGKVSADIDEKAIRRSDPKELVLALAHAKADAILDNGGLTHGYLITCDQVVVHEGRILEKPESEEEAREMIAGYARAPASTVGSTVVTRVETGDRVEHVDVATITFDEQGLPEGTIRDLIEEGEIFWCAGGLMVEHPQVQPWIVSMEGGMDSIMGLRKQTVVDLLDKLQY